MRKCLLTILGAVSICCLISTPAMASSKKHGKKGVKARSTTECTTEATTRGTVFSPAYGTLVHDGATSPYPDTVVDITVPFTAIQVERNITLDTTNDTFTLPKGVYALNFQLFTLTDNNGNTTSQNTELLLFSDIYLDINNGSAIVKLDWAMSYDNSNIVTSPTVFATFSGSKIFSIGADNTVVRFKIKRVSPTVTGSFSFNTLLGLYQGLGATPENDPIRVTLHKIDGCAV